MARLFEHQSKELLKVEGISIPRGNVATSLEDVERTLEEIGEVVAIKALVLHTGRGKLGGIRLVNTADEAYEFAAELFAKGLAGNPVDKILIEQKVSDSDEFFAGITLDDRTKGPLIMVSSRGGVDIETLAQHSPDVIGRMGIDYKTGLDPYLIQDILRDLSFPTSSIAPFSDALERLWKAFKKYEMTSLEVNPFFYSAKQGLVAGDCKANVDDYAVFRLPIIQEMIDIPRDFGHSPTQLERQAWLVEKDDFRGTFYFNQLVTEIKEDGFIGYHGGGGGGTMAGLDKMSKLGLKPASYVDTSGNPPGSKVYRAVKLILSIPGIQGYLCFSDAVAGQDLTVTTRGIIKAVKELRPDFPCIVRLVGSRAEDSQRICQEASRKWGLNLEYYASEKSTAWCIERMKRLIEKGKAQ
jgi:succinyl-CoA synthetase beta subunit